MSNGKSTRKQWDKMNKDEKNKIVIKYIIILAVAFIVFNIITSIVNGYNDVQTSFDNSSKTNQEQPKTEQTVKKLNYTFDVPSLLGKNIDSVRSVLGTPTDGSMTEPTSEQLSLGVTSWDNTFKKNGKELLVTFNPETREVTDFFIPTDDPSGATSDTQPLLEVGNLTEGSSSYTIENTKTIRDPSIFTGIVVRQN